MTIKSVTARCVLTFAALDLVFNPIVMAAFVQLLGVQGASNTWFIFTGLVALKIALCALFLTQQLQPYERFARARSDSRSEAALARADNALQAAPARFGLFYAFSWMLTYGLAFVSLNASAPEALNGRALEAVILVMIATSFGGWAFGFPLVSLLTADAARTCSVEARERKISLDRPVVSLQLRIALIALSLGLGPTLWMIALGYMKQVDASYEARKLHAQLAAADVAQSVTSSARPSVGNGTLAGLAGLLQARPAEPNETGRFIADARGNVLASAGSLPGGLESWLRQQLPRSAAAVWSPLDQDFGVAFRRVDAEHVAGAVVTTKLAASSSYLFSAGTFAVLVGLWAPLCAMVLGRAVSTPIERLTAAAREVVEEGKQSQMATLPVDRNDEVGLLTDRFNDLLDMMRDLSAGADAIAKGNLRVTIRGKGELPDAFRGMLESLRAMVRQISETSVDLGSAATEIFAASQEQEAAAASQSSAMEEISRTMDSLSESAAHVSDAVQGVLSNAERTLQNTDGMVRRIGELSSHAGRIAEILEVIRDIADKSDLLALNGSLEASRAGEGGHGFALVAAEMRRLAERVTASVQDVKKLVSDIRESGSSTVMATEESRRLAEGTTEAARQITFVTQQQRSGTEQVSQSIKSIADVVSQAVSATSQTRTSAEGLKAQADRLAELVRRFEVARPGAA